MTNTPTSYPSDALEEAKALRARVAELEDTSAMTEVYRLRLAITHAMERLDASMFTNAEHQQAKDILRAALGDDQ